MIILALYLYSIAFINQTFLEVKFLLFYTSLFIFLYPLSQYIMSMTNAERQKRYCAKRKGKCSSENLGKRIWSSEEKMNDKKGQRI